MSIGLRLDLRQTQQLVMTPQLQQAIKLLQMSNLELAEFVEREVQQNPLLEIEQAHAGGDAQEAPAPGPEDGPTAVDARVTPEGDHGLGAETFDNGIENLTDGTPSDGDPAAAGAAWRDRSVLGAPAGEAPALEERLAARPSLREHLQAQIGQASGSAHGLAVARHLIDELDEHGLLRPDIGEIAARLGTTAGVAEAALKLLQACEPTGVGARSVAECLALQLAEVDRLDPAMQTLLDNLDLVARGDWRRLRTLCGVDADDLSEMVRELRRLNPRPCAEFAATEPETLIPDILLQRNRWGGWDLELNPETLPRVLIDRTYATSLGGTGCPETRRYLGDCRANASWLVRSLDQRAQTILKIATEIVRQQQRFFDEGVGGLRPLNLRTVADAVGMHESTASRVTANKHIATERGIFGLKFFFTNGVGGDSDIAAESVRHRIRDMVSEEPSHAVLSDDTIVTTLRAEGIDIARRTVAKYRKSLNIPSSVERRRLKAGRETRPAQAIGGA